MNIPVWLTFAIATVVIIFGIYRLKLSFRSDVEEELDQKRRGLYRMSPRSHRLVGIVYLLLGIALVATGLGWNPFGGAIGPGTEQPAKGAEPSKAKLPEDGVK